MPRTCATMDLHAYLAATDAAYRMARREIEQFTAHARLTPRTGVVRIPVVVHVLTHGRGQGISDAQVESQIQVLNADFRAANADRDQAPGSFGSLAADARVEFVLAARDPEGRPTSGITRTRTEVASFDGAVSELDRAVKSAETGHVAWPRDLYLNVWVCSLGGGLLGYAQFPGGPARSDGVVILDEAFGAGGGARAPFDLGRTATHEVGHWLNLLHIWGDDEDGCTGSDNVRDTPNQAGPNSGKPTYPRVSCDNGPDGDLFVSFMDYVDDAAMCLFTAGQVARMDRALAGPRATLLSSDGLLPPDAGPVRLAAGRTFDGVGWV